MARRQSVSWARHAGPLSMRGTPGVVWHSLWTLYHQTPSGPRARWPRGIGTSSPARSIRPSAAPGRADEACLAVMMPARAGQLVCPDSHLVIRLTSRWTGVRGHITDWRRPSAGPTSASTSQKTWRIPLLRTRPSCARSPTTPRPSCPSRPAGHRKQVTPLQDRAPAARRSLPAGGHTSLSADKGTLTTSCQLRHRPAPACGVPGRRQAGRPCPTTCGGRQSATSGRSGPTAAGTASP